VQSLEFYNDTPQKVSIGVVIGRSDPYDFGTAEFHSEHITVIEGELIINDTLLEKGNSLDIHKGDPIVVTAKNTSVYRCVYGD